MADDETQCTYIDRHGTVCETMTRKPAKMDDKWAPFCPAHKCPHCCLDDPEFGHKMKNTRKECTGCCEAPACQFPGCQERGTLKDGKTTRFCVGHACETCRRHMRMPCDDRCADCASSSSSGSSSSSSSSEEEGKYVCSLGGCGSELADEQKAGVHYDEHSRQLKEMQGLQLRFVCPTHHWKLPMCFGTLVNHYWDDHERTYPPRDLVAAGQHLLVPVSAVVAKPDAEKPFQCPVCSKRYAYKANLDRHTSKEHPVVATAEEALFATLFADEAATTAAAATLVDWQDDQSVTQTEKAPSKLQEAVLAAKAAQEASLAAKAAHEAATAAAKATTAVYRATVEAQLQAQREVLAQKKRETEMVEEALRAKKRDEEEAEAALHATEADLVSIQ